MIISNGFEISFLVDIMKGVKIYENISVFLKVKARQLGGGNLKMTNSVKFLKNFVSK